MLRYLILKISTSSIWSWNVASKFPSVTHWQIKWWKRTYWPINTFEICWMQILILKSSTLPFHYFVVIPMSMDILQSNFATRQRSIGSSKWIILISRNYGNQKYEKMVPIESKIADLSIYILILKQLTSLGSFFGIALWFQLIYRC